MGVVLYEAINKQILRGLLKSKPDKWYLEVHPEYGNIISDGRMCICLTDEELFIDKSKFLEFNKMSDLFGHRSKHDELTFTKDFEIDSKTLNPLRVYQGDNYKVYIQQNLYHYFKDETVKVFGSGECNPVIFLNGYDEVLGCILPTIVR